ncbi:hypothetical protein EMIHUDRAFT_467083 [Emiliania huxleyi CCMP1516]|uniref:Uncharacterized protein n=2 Tax=Emiliania huxleyi TaxID=2903 RepID=A0A0D3I255_EMIH1|nr:hypothetical protein EMIHUDRAFT_461970 [Emiliania huxleyi CCMP1516]XP_005789545.1 hypothetical protein EMIHUDRAFT_467083 [Emiliania huxleyi CCMP1516]EOD05340.1 hypothetical protein EMIHUDRAFT_461970 [Emiliania huxleyi CCMP1516]EOD37116.1 hypothetical protein EMIHUDRAFT_467083 [Emiliania huxleyi CCMP1516]|eukprot:XP_005757769.1 hypothetical protein EMIHUDRAFT_461970 [Emiliania huxleyi CCMP1516]
MTPRDLVVLLASFCLSCDAFRLPAAGLRLPAGAAASSASSSSCCRMMFGGAGGKPDGEGGMGGFMEQMKAAKDMFNPENMKKYAALGQKIQALQEELGQTEVEVPLDVKVSDEMVAKGAEAVSAEVAAAMKQAHAKSGAYMQQRMAELYKELGIAEPPKQ